MKMNERALDVYDRGSFYFVRIIDTVASNVYKGHIATTVKAKFITDRDGDAALSYKYTMSPNNVWDTTTILKQQNEVKINNLELLMYSKEELIKRVLSNDKTLTNNVDKLYKRSIHNQCFKIHHTTFSIRNITALKDKKSKAAKKYMVYIVGFYKGYIIQAKVMPLEFTDGTFRKLKYLNQVAIPTNHGLDLFNPGDKYELTEITVPDSLIEKDKLHKMSRTIEKLLKQGYLYNESVIQIEQEVDKMEDNLRRHNKGDQKKHGTN
jgi:hypothetical protein